MTSIGTYELKTNLARFLDRVTEGEVIEVTRHGVVIAKLVPSKPQATYNKREAAKILKKLERVALPDTSIEALIQHGRKH